MNDTVLIFMDDGALADAFAGLAERGAGLTVLAPAASLAVAKAVAAKAEANGARSRALALPEEATALRKAVTSALDGATLARIMIIWRANAPDPLATITGEAWQGNVLGPVRRLFSVCQATTAAIAARGLPGVLVNVIETAEPRRAAHVASAAGAMLTRAIALDLGARGIRANALIHRTHSGGAEASSVRDAAGVAAFLLSDDAAYMTGTVIEAGESSAASGAA